MKGKLMLGLGFFNGAVRILSMQKYNICKFLMAGSSSNTMKNITFESRFTDNVAQLRGSLLSHLKISTVVMDDGDTHRWLH